MVDIVALCTIIGKYERVRVRVCTCYILFVLFVAREREGDTSDIRPIWRCDAILSLSLEETSD